ncbi:MAG TPA: aldo/keto reductase [Tepidisphaeraceae bacterium]|jgi:aryl-alcohol dehydrogenase-like predicted oxidoreductase
MRYRTLGKTGIRVSEVGFGAWGIGGEWGPKDDAQALASLRHALDRGVTFLDTAAVYGDGHSETLIGQAVAGRRDQVVIASKIPPKTFKWPVLPRDRARDTFPSSWVVEQTEQSLRRLRTDYLDLQQFHAWTPAYTHEIDWLAGVERLKREGKIRAWGVSANDWDPYGTTGLVESGMVDAVQVIYNIFEQRPREQLLPAAAKHNVGIIVRVPFEEGLLTGEMGPNYAFAPGDWRKDWLTPERLTEAKRRTDALRPFLDTADTPTLASLALKFCLAEPVVSTVIPGMRRLRNVDANVEASNSRPLDAGTVSRLGEHQFVHGWAYPWAQD